MSQQSASPVLAPTTVPGHVPSPGSLLRVSPAEPMPDLAPMIHRQRLVIEGYCDAPISAEAISAFLTELSDTIGMVTLVEPVTHKSPLYGWAGWIHWETSGAHFYAWDQPLLFFSVDVYACKPFQARDAVALAARHFGGAPVWKEF
ncbi:S-adenosylmethionine decarboxylase [Aquipuribacter nitratireducens]|uniref:S-adenosylmethionine decarboxylase n=1 Tax=Aquipuribacter nitratireducens TaxID=650104 RepID=A0ABW0GQ02_9MICO